MATTFGPPEVLRPAQVAEPVPFQGQVLVDVSVAPVLFLDTQIRAGLARQWFDTTPPYVPGMGIAGTVSALGPSVRKELLGQRLVADTHLGGYAERAVVTANSAVAVPEGLGFREAAALLHDGRTALGLVEATDPRPGEWVLVLGAAGGLGILLVQLAARAGAKVIAAARGEDKLALAREHGAAAVVDYSDPGWAEHTQAITGQTGPAVVLDGVGGTIGATAFEITAPGGRLSAHGTPSGGFAQIDRHQAEERGITVLGVDAVQFEAPAIHRLVGTALGEAAAGRLRPVIGQSVPLEEAADAHRAIEARTVTGKTLLEV